MRHYSTTLAAVILVPALTALHAPSRTATAVGTPCRARVAVLGADLSAGGRFEVQRALAVGPHTDQVVETLADETAQAGGLIPPALLTKVAVSSGLLRPLPAGSGLHVTVNPAITLDTAQTYANTLLTAGVTDAEVRVAAPSAQRALGTTALLGLLRAARATCLALDPTRARLAIREIVLASDLAAAPGVGRLAVAPLLFALKRAAASGRITAPAALTRLIARTATAQHVTVPPAVQPPLITYLHDLVSTGAYNGIAARAASLAGTPPATALVHLAPAAVPLPAAPAPTPFPPAPARAARSRAGLWRGHVIAAGRGTVTVRERRGTRSYRVVPGLPVDRNGRRSTLAALQPADSITVTTNAAGAVTRIDARADAPPARIGAPPVAESVLSTVLTAAALLVFLLLVIPLIVAKLRRHAARAARGAASRQAPRGQTVVFVPHEPARVNEGVPSDDA